MEFDDYVLFLYYLLENLKPLESWKITIFTFRQKSVFKLSLQCVFFIKISTIGFQKTQTKS